MNEGIKGFTVRLFGEIEVRTPSAILTGRDFGGAKQRRILALLALHGTLSKDHLAELLWESAPPAEYVATLESHVSLLRRKLDPTRPGRQSVVVTRPGGYCLDFERVDTDVARFDTLITTASRLSAESALATLTTAVELAAAPLLADEPYPSWADQARARHRLRLVEAATRAAEFAIDLGRTAAAQALASRATDLDALAERAWRVRMRAYRAAGDRAAALRCYDTLRRTLSDELAVVPAAATQALFIELLRDAEHERTHVEAATERGCLAAAILAAKELAVVEERTGMLPARVITLLTQAHQLATYAPVAGRALALQVTG